MMQSRLIACSTPPFSRWKYRQLRPQAVLARVSQSVHEAVFRREREGVLPCCAPHLLQRNLPVHSGYRGRHGYVPLPPPGGAFRNTDINLLSVLSGSAFEKFYSCNAIQL